MSKRHSLTCTFAIFALTAAPSIAVADDNGAIDFGDDSSEWASDGECDDARFIGAGVSSSLITENIGRDASDCQAKFANGDAELNPLFAVPTDESPIDFGDNGSDYADNGVCDDIRFTGEYASEVVYIVQDIGRDANDCRAAYEAGSAKWQGNETRPANGISMDDMLVEMSDQ
ncbi:MAG: hypothetical protein AAGL68_01665 [Pseudomonadota bacterium]